jgi:ATP-dependent Clp protease ATP-binding subunit ClpB
VAINAGRKGRIAGTSPAEAETAYDALKKYTRDLSKEVRAGEFVILFGRDEEIRRTIQVLSPRAAQRA